MKVACSEFVKRQTKESGYSHFEGTWEELEVLARSLFNTGFEKPGYKDGVVLLKVPDNHTGLFRSSTVTINEDTKLSVKYAPRMKGEDPFIRVAARASKQPAVQVYLICYRADVLAEDDDRSTNADWEIIAIKAQPTKGEEPMDPYTMARNFLHLKGGTKGDFTAQQFAESIVYWNSHCMCVGKPKWYRRIKAFFNNI
jgi:hypothetical protein